MKSRSRFSSLTAVALTLFILAGPLSALPRHRDDRDGQYPPIVRVLKKIAKFFNIQTLDDFPGPPKP